MSAFLSIWITHFRVFYYCVILQGAFASQGSALQPARLFRRALPCNSLKDFLKKVLKNPKNFERNASLISE